MFEERQNLTQQFKKKIRRRQIDQLFARKRLQLILTNQDEEAFITEETTFTQFCREVQQKIHGYRKQHLEVLAKLSRQKLENNTKINGDKLINFLIGYLQECYLNTHEQYLSTIVLNNVFYSNSNNHHKSFFPLSPVYQQLFFVSLNSWDHTRENCMSIIFQIIHDMHPQNIELMVKDPKLNIIIFLLQQVKSQPNESILEQVLKCFVLLMKKLDNHVPEECKKMKKFLCTIIKNTLNIPLLYLGILGLIDLIRYFPEENNFSQPTFIVEMTKKVLQTSMDSLIILLLKFISIYLPNASSYEIQNNFIPFFTHLISESHSPTICSKTLQLIYRLIKICHQMNFIAQNYPNLIQMILNSLNKTQNQQNLICSINCTCMMLWNFEGINPYMLEEAKTKLQQICLQNKYLSEKTLFFIENTLECYKDKMHEGNDT